MAKSPQQVKAGHWRCDVCFLSIALYAILLMKAIRLTRRAATALRKHRNMAARIMAKIEDYAANPASTEVKMLRGSTTLRFRIGDYRVLFEETGDEIIILDIGPRGSIYE
jgi:mRNA interferase RelE/StbE